MSNGLYVKEESLTKRFFRLITLGDGSPEAVILLLLALSVWAHYIVSGVMMLALFILILAIPSARDCMLRQPKMLIFGILISFFSFFVSTAAKNLIGMGISVAVFLILALGAFAKGAMTEKRFKCVQITLCAVSPVAAAAAFYQNFVMYGDNALFRPTAGAFNANYYGTLTVMTVLICIYNILDGEKKPGLPVFLQPSRIFYAVILLINCAMLLVSESRSSLLALMICTIFYLFITKRYLLFSLAICLAAGVATVGWFFPDVLSWTNSLSYSFTERSGIWGEAMKSFSQSPLTALFGRGPMTYYHVREAEGLMIADHAHNVFVDTLLNVGIIGTALYLMLSAYFVKEALVSGKAGNERAFVIGLIFVLEVAVQGIADVTIMWHQSAIFFLLCMAVTGIRCDKRKE